MRWGSPHVHQAGLKLRFPSLSLLNAGITSYPGLVWFCVALIILELDMQTRVASNSQKFLEGVPHQGSLKIVP